MAFGDPLVWVRAIHFAATLSAPGVVFFLAFVGEPAFRLADTNGSIPVLVRKRLARIAWVSLVLIVLTGVAWLMLNASQMSERPLAAVWSEGIVWTILFGTDFGYVWMARFGLVVLLAVALFATTGTVLSLWRCIAALTLGAALVGTLAFAGHAAAGAGIEGVVHQTADVLHLVAAASWVGALVPLAILLRAVGTRPDGPSIAIAREAAVRFSTLGIVGVGTVLATGMVNTWVLVGSVPALIGTDYGRLLLLKVALFTLMLLIAAVNRLRLTPAIVQANDTLAGRAALRQLQNNSLSEACMGAIILFIVGVLGTLPPALQP